MFFSPFVGGAHSGCEVLVTDELCDVQECSAELVGSSF